MKTITAGVIAIGVVYVLMLGAALLTISYGHSLTGSLF